MKMANHPRPGDIIQEALEELNVSLREFARAMEIAPSTASRLLTGKAALTPEMAIKLSVVIGSSPEMWLNLQNTWSLAEAQKSVDISRLRKLAVQGYKCRIYFCHPAYHLLLRFSLFPGIPGLFDLLLCRSGVIETV